MVHNISCVLCMSTSFNGQLLTFAGDHSGVLKVQLVDFIITGLIIIIISKLIKRHVCLQKAAEVLEWHVCALL